MKINQDEYQENDRVIVSADLDDSDGWSWKLKNKRGSVHFDEFGFTVKTDEGDILRPSDITKIKTTNT